MFLLVQILASASGTVINHILLCVLFCLTTWAEFTSVLVSGLDADESTKSFLTSRNGKAVSFKPVFTRMRMCA